MTATPFTIEANFPSLNEAIRLTGSGFGHSLTPAEITVLRLVLRSSVTGYTARDTESNAAVGYGAFRTSPTPHHGDTLFVSSLMTQTGYRGGVGRAILDAAIAADNPSILAFNTSSPSMYAAGVSRTTELYPRLDGEPTPPDLAELALLYCPGPADYPVYRNLYKDGPLYSTRPEHPLAEQFYSYPGYSYENGDALLCLGRVAART